MVWLAFSNKRECLPPSVRGRDQVLMPRPFQECKLPTWEQPLLCQAGITTEGCTIRKRLIKGELVMRNVQEANVPGMAPSVAALTHVNNSAELEYVTGGINWQAIGLCPIDSLFAAVGKLGVSYVLYSTRV